MGYRSFKAKYIAIYRIAEAGPRLFGLDFAFEFFRSKVYISTKPEIHRESFETEAYP